eukprot:g5140.t1
MSKKRKVGNASSTFGVEFSQIFNDKPKKSKKSKEKKRRTAKRVEDLMGAANQLYSRGFRSDAKEKLQEVILLDASFASPWKTLALIYEEEGNDSLALEACLMAAKFTQKNDPSALELYKRAGAYCLRLKDYERAVEAFTGALDINPEDVGALERRSSILKLLKHYAPAANDYLVLLTKFKPKSFHMFKNYLSMLHMAGELEECIRVLVSVLGRLGNNFDPLSLGLPSHLTTKKLENVQLELSEEEIGHLFEQFALILLEDFWFEEASRILIEGASNGLRFIVGVANLARNALVVDRGELTRARKRRKRAKRKMEALALDFCIFPRAKEDTFLSFESARGECIKEWGRVKMLRESGGNELRLRGQEVKTLFAILSAAVFSIANSSKGNHDEKLPTFIDVLPLVKLATDGDSDLGEGTRRFWCRDLALKCIHAQCLQEVGRGTEASPLMVEAIGNAHKKAIEILDANKGSAGKFDLYDPAAVALIVPNTDKDDQVEEQLNDIGLVGLYRSCDGKKFGLEGLRKVEAVEFQRAALVLARNWHGLFRHAMAKALALRYGLMIIERGKSALEEANSSDDEDDIEMKAYRIELGGAAKKKAGETRNVLIEQMKNNKSNNEASTEASTEEVIVAQNLYKSVKNSKRDADAFLEVAIKLLFASCRHACENRKYSARMVNIDMKIENAKSTYLGGWKRFCGNSIKINAEEVVNLTSKVFAMLQQNDRSDALLLLELIINSHFQNSSDLSFTMRFFDILNRKNDATVLTKAKEILQIFNGSKHDKELSSIFARMLKEGDVLNDGSMEEFLQFLQNEKMLGHYYAEVGNYSRALGYVLNAVMEEGNESLLIGAASLLLGTTRYKNTDRALCIADAFALISEYGRCCNGDTGEFFYNLARCYQSVGNEHIALPLYFKAIEEGALKRECAYNVSLMYKKSGRPDLARSVLKKYF